MSDDQQMPAAAAIGQNPRRRSWVAAMTSSSDRMVVLVPGDGGLVDDSDVAWINQAMRLWLQLAASDRPDGPLERAIAYAIDNPGSVVPRKRAYTDPERPDWSGFSSETTLEWQTRAVVSVVRNILGAING